MTPEQRQQIETQIKNDFAEIQKTLENLKNEVQLESDEVKKQEKNEEINRLEGEAAELKTKIDNLSSLEEQALQSLKTRLESLKVTIDEANWEKTELLNEKYPTPTTYELLKDSETCNWLYTIISSNPNEFKNIPWDTAEAKLEYIFTKIRNNIVLYMKNKLWSSNKTEYVINNTIAPAIEWSLMEMLKQDHDANVGMLKWVDKISFSSFKKLFNWLGGFAQTTSESYDKFNQWMNAIDYLSVHNWVLNHPEKSEILTNPIKFKAYMNNDKFKDASFSPYAPIEWNIFEISGSETFAFWLSITDKQSIIENIWKIKVKNNPETISLMLDKPKKFLKKSDWLQKVANSFLNWVNSLNSITKIFWIDILWDISKSPEERNPFYRILDFICKLIWITWLEWIVKRWRLDRMNLTNKKNDNIRKIFEEYKELIEENTSLTITDESSCKTALNDFAVTDLKYNATTKWDYLRDSIVKNMDISLISPAIVKQAIEENVLSKNEEKKYLKEEIVTVRWKQQKKFTIISSWFTLEDKKKLAQYHLSNMKSHLQEYDKNDLKDFYTTIDSTDDIALCITASLYADKDDVIEWVKARVFLPENYWVVRMDWTVQEITTNPWRENLDSTESLDKQIVTEPWVYDKAVEYWITDNRQIAYVLSTIKWESWFKNQKEIWWEDREYWRVDSVTWKAYYGRWFIQLTLKDNYENYTQIIRNYWKDFKANDGNIIKWSEIDLVNNPDIILKSNELAIFIAIHWMKNWTFTWEKLDDYINNKETDFVGARAIVNGSDKADSFARNAQLYLDDLNRGTVSLA